eukprot:CAMPEP_0117657114 /NCGR_PEP_ID=MMETSP0804-20121206/5160_1 /TAXON_ID=1074897 /ORGANISM="Tetraselmis astigmatica, Strain CCMP880" /LENGTH=396 /DNA_ID=CAMNT_0005463551 /DNA_START=590 /DNA_END=1780 /DNA_ORIENTATION=-
MSGNACVLPSRVACKPRASLSHRSLLTIFKSPALGVPTLLCVRNSGAAPARQPRQDRFQPCAVARPRVTAASARGSSAMETFSSYFTNLFPLWNVAAAVLALKEPAAFSFMSTDYFTAALAVLMFSMGITMTMDDFKRVANKPGPIIVNFLACYIMMPVLGLCVAKLFGLAPALVAGCVLVGAINGGQASNLCTYIAKGDVALSVLMTTTTTIGTIFMTPLIAKIVLGALVPVDAMGIVISTIQVVLAPIFIGVLANKLVPKWCRAVEPISPIVGVICTVILVGASVAKCAGPILQAGVMLQFPLIILHLIGGLAGYYMCKAAKYDEIVARTTAIETSMKSSAFGFLLATLHFQDPMVKVPAAVSVVWMAVIGSALGVYWSGKPVEPPVPTLRPSA